MDPLVELAGMVLPPALRLRDGPLWRLQSQGKTLNWSLQAQTPGGDQVTARYTQTDGTLLLCVTGKIVGGALVVETTLCNPASERSIALSLIEPLRMLLELPAGADVLAQRIAGGVSERLYPPHAFRIDTVRLDYRGELWLEHGRDGRSSNEHLPFLLAAAGDCGWAMALEWSGLWLGHLDATAGDGSVTNSIEISVRNLVLEPGEHLALPAAHYLFSKGGGLDGVTNAIRRYLREHVMPPVAEPVLNYNHWFGLGPNVNEQKMLAVADAAQKAGLEYYVLDAGWYAGCVGDDFEPGVGNWNRVDGAKFPRGLEPLAERVGANGMHFGLWFEPERAHRTSDWFRQHPEWFIDIGQPYMHLNLALREAQDACIKLLVEDATRLKLGWLKIDYNIGPLPYWQKADPTLKIQFGYVAGLYRVLDELRRAMPEMLIETCASGGRRIDLGTLRRSHQVWISDESMSSENVRFMLAGANYILPGHVNNECLPFGRTEGNRQFTDYDMACRMLGSLALHGDLTMLSDQDLARLRILADVYRSFRHLLSEDFFPLLPQARNDSEWQAVQFCKPDGTDAVVLAFSGRDAGSPATTPVRLKGLDADRTYTITALHKKTPTSERTGSALMRNGLRPRLAARNWAAWRVEVQ